MSPGSFADAAEHTISMYSLSKAYGFAGWRIGYMVYPEHLAAAMIKSQDTILICPPIASQVARRRQRSTSAGRTASRTSASSRRFATSCSTELSALGPLRDRAGRRRRVLLPAAGEHDDGSAGARRTAHPRAPGRGHPRDGVRHDRGCYFRVAYGALQKATVAEGIGRLVDGAAQPYVCGLDVQLLGFLGALHDEAEARRRILAHQLVDHAIGHDLIGDSDPQQAARARVERRLPQHLRHHLAETLEARDLRRRPAAVLAVLLQDRVALRVVERPERLLADVDAIERRLREEDLAVAS